MVHNVSIGGQTTGDNYTEGSNDEPVAGSEGLGCVVWEDTDMKLILILTMSAVAFLAAKKKPLFGQMTLTGMLAVDWLKDGMEVDVRKITLGNPQFLTDDWNIPEWALEKKTVGLLFPMNEWENPIFVSQNSVLQWLEAKCAEWEAAGATVEGNKHTATIEFGDDSVPMTFNRDKNGGKFAKYICELK